MISFKRYLMVEEDVSVLQQYLKQKGISFPQLVQQLQAGNPHGQGGNSDFYKIPDTNYGIRIKRRGAQAETGSQQLTPAHNPFGDENHGQPVAQYGNNVEVLKLQPGKPAGIRYKRSYKDPDTPEDIDEFRQQILHAAAMPQEEYNRLLKSIVDLNNKGYQVDPSKSGNLLIDPNSGRFNLVDLNKADAGSTYRNTGGEIIIMLMGVNAFSKHLYKDEEMKKASLQIIQKVEAAAEVSGMEMRKDYSGSKFAYSLAQGQYEPYVPPPPDPNEKKQGWGHIEV